MENSIKLPECISDLKRIQINTLEESLKFELLMELFETKSLKDLEEIVQKINK